MIDEHDGYTPTPSISHAILTYNRSRTGGLADGIVITPSHNPPEDGGFKYNPPNGGPADTDVTTGSSVPRTRCWKTICVACSGSRTNAPASPPACTATTTSVPMSPTSPTSSTWRRSAAPASKSESIRWAAPSVHFWRPIIERYGIDATIVNDIVDPTFRFMTRRLGRQDPHGLLVALCDGAADRHARPIRRRLRQRHRRRPARHRHPLERADESEPLSGRCIAYLFEQSSGLGQDAAVGKTIVSSAIIDRVAAKLGRRLVEVPVGFKWFVDGLIDGSLGFAGEESAGASFLRRDGSVWTTDKDGIILGPARRRDHRANRPGPQPAVRSPHRRTRRAVLRADRRARDRRAERIC